MASTMRLKQRVAAILSLLSVVRKFLAFAGRGRWEERRGEEGEISRAQDYCRKLANDFALSEACIRRLRSIACVLSADHRSRRPRRRHQWWVARTRTVALKAGRKRRAGASKGMLPLAPRATASDAAAVAACAVPHAARARSARAWVPASVSYPCGRVHSCPILHSCSERAAPVWGRRSKGIACHARLPQPLQDALTARTRGGVCFRARRSLPRARACRAAWLLSPAAHPPSRLALCAEEPLSSDCGASCHRCGACCHRSGEHARVRAAQTRDGQP